MPTAAFAGLLLLLVQAAPRLHRDARLVRALAAFRAHPGEPYVIQTATDGARWFHTTQGPCSCLIKDPVATCTSDLSATLQEEQQRAREQASTTCVPNAGCAPGFIRVLVECLPSKEKPPPHRAPGGNPRDVGP